MIIKSGFLWLNSRCCVYVIYSLSSVSSFLQKKRDKKAFHMQSELPQLLPKTEQRACCRRRRSNVTFQWAVNARNTKGSFCTYCETTTMMLSLLLLLREPLFLFFGLETFLSYMSGLEKRLQVRLGVSPSCHTQKAR